MASLHFFYIFRDNSCGYLDFFMDKRLGTLYSNGNWNYDYDNSAERKKFVGRLHEAKMDVASSGPLTKSILTIPCSSQTIQSGNWCLSSVEADTMLVANREGIQKLIIKGESVYLVSTLMHGQH